MVLFLIKPFTLTFSPIIPKPTKAAFVKVMLLKTGFAETDIAMGTEELLITWILLMVGLDAW